MKAFHGDDAVKQKYLARLKAHHAADEIIQGTGYIGTHGCAVGCTLNAYDHAAYENELGLPIWLAYLEDQIFEGLPSIEAQQFAVDFLEAVPVGANVEYVRWKLAIYRHTQDRDRLLSNKEPYAEKCVSALNQVIAYCKIRESSARSKSSGWSLSARWSAVSASSSARRASWAAGWSKAGWAAASAEASADSSYDVSPSSSAVRSARASSSECDHYRWEAKTLIEILKTSTLEGDA